MKKLCQQRISSARQGKILKKIRVNNIMLDFIFLPHETLPVAFMAMDP
jgi:hypothetical protein